MRGITDRRLLRAFNKVERHRFVREEIQPRAYDDMPLDIGHGQRLAPPYTVALMTYVVGPGYDKKVLEVGTGSGYHAAVLAELFKSVYTIELLEPMGREAKKRLERLGYENITFKIGDGYKGWEKHAPFDAIIVNCSEDHIPQPLMEQLADGGKLIIPVSYDTYVQELVLLEKNRDKKAGWKKTRLVAVVFPRLVRKVKNR